MNRISLCTALIGALLSVTAIPASAVEIQWFSVQGSANPDFHDAACGSCSQYYTNMVQSTLSGGGVPVVAGTGFNVVEAPGTALTWWTPGSNGVTLEGVTNQPLPINQNMFVSEGTGTTNQGGYFQTAILTTEIKVGPGGGSIVFGGDDDTFIALNNQIVGQEGGIHPFTYGAPILVGTGTPFGPGTYELTMFYADRQIVAAQAYLGLTGDVSAVPEPSTWAMIILGFAGVGFMAYRRKQNGPQLRLA